MTNNQNDDYKRDIRQEQQPAPPPGSSPSPPHMPYTYPHAHAHAHIKRPNRFLLFILSPLPGLGHMYMGLMRRGLFYIFALALIILLTVAIAPSILVVLTSFAIAALFAMAFFEAFAIRRDIVMGKEAKDTLPNIAMFGGGKNKALLAVLIFAFVVVLGINILTALPWYAWLVIGIVAVCYLSMRHDKKE